MTRVMMLLAVAFAATDCTGMDTLAGLMEVCQGKGADMEVTDLETDAAEAHAGLVEDCSETADPEKCAEILPPFFADCEDIVIAFGEGVGMPYETVKSLHESCTEPKEEKKDSFAAVAFVGIALLY